MTLKELKSKVDPDTWKIYEKGLCCTVNQVDSDWGTSLAMRYKPKSIDEVAKLTAAIRPSFDPWRDTFISRKPYTNHNAQMDKLLEPTDHYILFQENIMQFFEWLNISPAKSIGLIKKISKKKIKDSDFEELEDGLRESWIEKCGSIQGFQENWDMIQSCMAYGFNCLSGENRILIKYKGDWKEISVSELYAEKMKYIFLLSSSDMEYILKESKFIEDYRKPKYVYSYDEHGYVVKNLYNDLAFVGYKEFIEIYTQSRAMISCTLDHKFPTDIGYRKAKELSVGDSLLYGNAKGRRKWVKKDPIVKIVSAGVKRAYHISVQDPLNTFTLSNGIITSNSPHALAYGYDSTYGAYLKSHYPLQYYTVVLNIYDADLKRTNKLIQELHYFGISLSAPKFGKSIDRYIYDEETRTIYKSVKAIKYLNSQVARELYALRENKYHSFVDVLYDIDEKTTADKTCIMILIKLDFFSEFGLSKNLLFLYKQFLFLKKGDAKRIAKDKIEDNIVYEIIRDNSDESECNFNNPNCHEILLKIESLCKEKYKEDFSVVEKMRFQEEYMGYISFNSNRPEDRFKLAILDIRALTKKSDGSIWAREIDAISIGTSKRNKLVISEDYFMENQLIKGDVIKISPSALQKKESKGFVNWWLKAYTIIMDEKVSLDNE